MPAVVIWKLSISQQINSLGLQSGMRRVLLKSGKKHRWKNLLQETVVRLLAKQKHPAASFVELVNWTYQSHRD